MKTLINGIAIAVLLLVCVPQEIKAGQGAGETKQKSKPAASKPQPQPSPSVIETPIGQPTSQPPDASPKTNTPSGDPAPTDEQPKVTDWLNFLASLLLLFVIAGQTFIYWKQQKYAGRQWNAMRRGLVQTRKIIRQNEQVVDAMRVEHKILHTHAGAMFSQARFTKEMLNETRDLVVQNAEMLKIERTKTNPRLRVSKIRIENFEVGQSPIFITTVANDGFIDATGVELQIGINLGDGREFSWIEPQTVMIPARGEESYPIITGASLSERDMEGFRTVVPIEVKVRVKYWPGSPAEPQEFCYRYFPWPGKRPDDVRQFFPCDFKHNLNISLHISGMELKATVGTVGVVIKKSQEEGQGNREEETK